MDYEKLADKIEELLIERGALTLEELKFRLGRSNTDFEIKMVLKKDKGNRWQQHGSSWLVDPGFLDENIEKMARLKAEAGKYREAANFFEILTVRHPDNRNYLTEWSQQLALAGSTRAAEASKFIEALVKESDEGVELKRHQAYSTLNQSNLVAFASISEIGDKAVSLTCLGAGQHMVERLIDTGTTRNPHKAAAAGLKDVTIIGNAEAVKLLLDIIGNGTLVLWSPEEKQTIIGMFEAYGLFPPFQMIILSLVIRLQDPAIDFNTPDDCAEIFLKDTNFRLEQICRLASLIQLEQSLDQVTPAINSCIELALAPLCKKPIPIQPNIHFHKLDERPQQRALMENIINGLHGGNSLIQGPTGIGKTLAMIIATMQYRKVSNHQVVLSTSTVVLQKNLYRILLVAFSGMGSSDSVVFLAGRSHYLCQHRVKQLIRQNNQWANLLIYWMEVTETGLYTELEAILHSARVNEARQILLACSPNPTECDGCARNICYYKLARQKARNAGAVVINHAVLPTLQMDNAVLIADEAHALEDAFTSFYTRVLSFKNSDLYYQEITQIMQSFARSLNIADNDTVPIKEVLKTTPEFIRLVNLLIQKAKDSRSAALLRHLKQGHLNKHAIWFVGEDEEINIHFAPLEIRKEASWCLRRFAARVLLSATISVEDKGEFVAYRLGLADEFNYSEYPSPFNLAEQAAICIPKDFPLASGEYEQDFRQEAASLIIQLAATAGGRTLVLFNSLNRLKLMKEACLSLAETAGLEILAVDEGLSREAIIRKFKEERGIILFGLRSFAEGVDFPGDQLQCLILETLPFAGVDDPLVAGRMAMYEESGFEKFYFPMAALRFAQACGRLIRTQEDKGIIVVLDKRMAFMDYAELFRSVVYPIPVYTEPSRDIVIRLNRTITSERDILIESSGQSWELLPQNILPDEEYTRYRHIITDMLDRLGYASFRPGQERIIRRILSGRNVVALMHTGSGKSLCFQLPALIRRGLTLVVTPVVALMKDQVDHLREKGFDCADYISYTQSRARREEVLFRLTEGQLRLLYVSPERLADESFRKILKRQRVIQLVVDEAHCISQWGHSFRPEFLRIIEWLADLGPIPVSAFTATAPQTVMKDICNYLKIKPDETIVDLSPRKNLYFGVIDFSRYQPEQMVAHKLQLLLAMLAIDRRPTIVYAAARHHARVIYNHLKAGGIRVALYTGEMEGKERNLSQELFFSKQVDVMVATSAFGMGIDRADVRRVIHFEMPSSLEAYYQEAGRAGRDGRPADCLLFYHWSDEHINRSLVQKNIITPDDIKFFIYQLNNISWGSGLVSVEELASSLKSRPRRLRTEVNLNVLFYHAERMNWVNKTVLPRTIHISRIKSEKVPKILGFIKDLPMELTLQEIVSHSGYDIQDTVRKLTELGEQGIVHWLTLDRQLLIQYSGPLPTEAAREFDFRPVYQYQEQALAGIEKVTEYTKGNFCRTAVIQLHMGSPMEKPCGNCDCCLGQDLSKHLVGVRYIGELWDDKQQVLRLIKDTKGRFTKEIYTRYLTMTHGAWTEEQYEYLVEHPSYGSLAYRGYSLAYKLIDDMVRNGQIQEHFGGYLSLDSE